jgi:5-methylcytosine-specific restriction endonuclease McrA
MVTGFCVYCGAGADTVDHVWPLARGGQHVVQNLAPACRACNTGKNDHLLTEWDAARVAHAAERSPVVAAELARLINLASNP